jgi:hypothetical protein
VLSQNRIGANQRRQKAFGHGGIVGARLIALESPALVFTAQPELPHRFQHLVTHLGGGQSGGHVEPALLAVAGREHNLVPAQIELESEVAPLGQAHRIGHQTLRLDFQADVPPLWIGLGVDPGYNAHDVSVQMQSLAGRFPAGQGREIECC